MTRLTQFWGLFLDRRKKLPISSDYGFARIAASVHCHSKIVAQLLGRVHKVKAEHVNKVARAVGRKKMLEKQ